jgi:O-antigen ligase
MTESTVAPGARRLRLAAWLGIAMVAAYMVAVGGNYYGIASTPAQLTTQVIAYVALGGWVVLAVVSPRWRPQTPLLAAVLIAALAYALSGFFSTRPRLSLEPTLAGLAFAVCFVFLTRLLQETWFRTRIGGLLVLGTVIVTTAYLIQVTVEWVKWWSLIGRLALPPLRPSFVGLTFGSPNLIATFLYLAGPLALVILYRRAGRWPAAVLAAGAIFAIFVTGSRGAYLGIALAIAFVAALFAATPTGRTTVRSGLRLVRQRRFLLVPAVIVVLVAVAAVPLVIARFAQGGDTLRLDLWRSALTIFSQHPIFGGGPGTWVQLKVEANPPGSPNLILPHAHDLYVQAAAELGIVGLGALAFLAVAVLHRLITAIRGQSSELRLEATAVLAGQIAFAGQSLVDNLVNAPFVCLLVILLVAWVDAGLLGPATAPARPRPFSGGGVAMPALVGLAMLLAVPTLIRIDQANLASAAGNDAAEAGDWQVALDRYQAAVADDPDFTLYRIQLGSSLARVGRVAEAREQYAIATAADRTPIVLISLAVLDLAAGDTTRARSLAGEAADLGPFDPNVALNAGRIGEAVGDVGFASDQYANVFSIDPAAARSDYWDSPDRAVIKSDVVSAAIARSDAESAAPALIAAYTGDGSAADRILSGVAPSRHRDTVAAAVTWLEGDAEGAGARLERLVADDPRDWFAAAWASRVARLGGDQTDGDRYAQVAMIDQADVALSVIAERSILASTPTDDRQGLPDDYPWAVYLRPIPTDLLPTEVMVIGAR